MVHSDLLELCFQVLSLKVTLTADEQPGLLSFKPRCLNFRPSSILSGVVVIHVQGSFLSFIKYVLIT